MYMYMYIILHYVHVYTCILLLSVLSQAVSSSLSFPYASVLYTYFPCTCTLHHWVTCITSSCVYNMTSSHNKSVPSPTNQSIAIGDIGVVTQETCVTLLPPWRQWAFSVEWTARKNITWYSGTPYSGYPEMKALIQDALKYGLFRIP